MSRSVRQCCRARRSEVFNYFPFSIQFVEINEMKRKDWENCYSKQWPLADMALVGRSRRSPAIIEVSSFHTQHKHKLIQFCQAKKEKLSNGEI